METSVTEKIIEIQKNEILEKLIQPETPEQPLIRVRESIEKGCFESVFALELSGIGRRAKNREESKRGDEQREGFQERYKKLLLSGLAEKQQLDFIYSGGRDTGGKPYFSWTIMGRSEGESREEAVAMARQLWQGLHVVAETLKHDYAFAPVIEARKLQNESVASGWRGRIQHIGIAVNADAHLPMGFARNQEGNKKKTRVLINPVIDTATVTSFDSLALGATGCESEIKLVVSMGRIRLSEKDQQETAAALRWLRKGERKQISVHEGREGVDDKKIMESLETTLARWTTNSMGYRVTCTAFSQEPIPQSFLKLVGSELMQGPFSIELKKVNDEQATELESVGSERKDVVLDLRDCVNSAALLPPLFPCVETLHACNVKRSYVNDLGEQDPEGILLGRVGQGDLSKPIRFSSVDRSRHAYIIGSTGTGKSTLLFNMIKQDMKAGEGVCLIDPHGDLFQQVLCSVPKARVEDVVIVDPCDFDHAVGINFLETGDFNKGVQMNFVVNEMLKIFDRLFDLRLTGGPIFEQYMRNAMLLLMDNEYADATLTDIPLLFEDADFRKFLKKGCKSPLVESFWTKMAEQAGGEASLQNVAPYIASKLTPFVYNALLRPIIGQPKSTINFRELIDNRKILLINLSKGLLGEMDTQLLGMLIIGKIFSSAMGRVTMRAEDRKPLYLYVDEFQNFTTDSVAHLLSEARKFGICLTLANQNLSQLNSNKGSQNILDAVLGNVGSTLMLRMGIVDAEKMCLYTKPEIDAQELQNLPDYHVAARLLNKNAPSKPFVFKTLFAPEQRAYETANTIKTMSRFSYATDTKTVEREIIKRRTAYQNKA